ncbi:hypothetical protein MKX01_027853, partial [Papaver californicum]
MMTTYKNYIEGSIVAQYDIDEKVCHCMEFIPEVKQKSYKCHGKVSMRGDVYEGPLLHNLQGKPYKLTSVQYEQVRIWFLRYSDENTEWE